MLNSMVLCLIFRLRPQNGSVSGFPFPFEDQYVRLQSHQVAKGNLATGGEGAYEMELLLILDTSDKSEARFSTCDLNE